MSRLDLKRIRAKCTEDGDCLIWQGKTYKNGHPAGTEWLDGRDCYVGVRRRAYEGYHGVTLQPDQQVATCGHPGCLAKAHLHIVTVSERSERMHRNLDAATKIRRGKTLARIAHETRGKVSPEQVAAVRASADGPYITAKRLGISGVVASRIKRGLSYKEYAASPFAGLGAANESARRSA